MLRLDELEKVLKLRQALGIPLDEGSCFGVSDRKELRPRFNPRREQPEEPPKESE